MDVIHKGGQGKRTGEGTSSFLLTNGSGDFLSLTSPSISDYDGLFIHENDQIFKILADILPSKSFTTITNNFSWVERSTDCEKEDFLLDTSGLLYRHEGDCAVTFTFDCKKIYDESTQGRAYHIEKEQDTFCVTYTKYADDSRSKQEYTLYILLHAQEAVPQIINSWRKMYVPYDARRGMQGERYVFDACSISGNVDVLITASTNKEEAYRKLHALQKDMHMLHKEKHTQPKQEQEVLLSVAHSAFNALIAQNDAQERGIYAGLPWFFQFWMRDEAISSIGLLLQEEYVLMKSILLRWIDKIAEHNIHANQLIASNMSVDGPGLVAKRLSQLLEKLHAKKRLKEFFSEQELQRIYTVYETYLSELTYTHGLVRSGPKETWMDTIVREGYRVEIQACTVAIYNLQLQLCDFLGKPKKQILHNKEVFILQVREWLYDLHGKILDGFTEKGMPDERVRPNIFLAYYIASELFLPEQWEKGFDFALEEIWLSWGGLASISVREGEYHAVHTGIDDKSYHNGDSWYFINNIAAITLFSVDPHKYVDKIEQILNASTHDLLLQGYLGHMSELSDAKQQRSSGCRAQAWSVATFIELLHVLKHH